MKSPDKSARYNRTIRYRGAIYRLAFEQSTPADFRIDEIVPHAELAPRGAVESGDAFCPKGFWHPLWVDDSGGHWAEVYPPDEFLGKLPADQYFLPIDDRPGWKWTEL